MKKGIMQTGKIWTFLGAFMMFAACGLVVYAASNSGIFDKYKVANLSGGVLTAEMWDDFMSTLNARVEVSCPAGEFLDPNYQCRPCDVGRYSPGGAVTSCTPCSNKQSRLPEGAVYTSNGTDNNCSWECADGYTQINGLCSDEVRLYVHVRNDAGGVMNISEMNFRIGGLVNLKPFRSCDYNDLNSMFGQTTCEFYVYRYYLEQTNGKTVGVYVYDRSRGWRNCVAHNPSTYQTVDTNTPITPYELVSGYEWWCS